MARAWPLRITLFLITNLAVLVVFGVLLRLLGLEPASASGLLIFAGVFGFGGSLVSLALSKRMALMSTGARIIGSPRDRSEAWLVSTVEDLAAGAGIGQPDVAVYDSPVPNAFATGMWRNPGSGSRLHRPAPGHAARRGPGRAGPRGGPRGQRGHGHPVPAAGCAEHLCDRGGSGRRGPDRRVPVPGRGTRPGPRLLRGDHGRSGGVRVAGQHRGDGLQPPPRVPGPTPDRRVWLGHSR